MNDLSTERTPLVIAAEINMITQQTRKILLASAVEIGRRLKEAKSMINHGEWEKWLEESVSYSLSTARRLMQLYEEYGASFLDELGLSNHAPVRDLTYTQALLLLGLPEDEREEFLAQNDVAGMTKLELQQALKDRDLAKQKSEEIQQENKALKKGLEGINSAISSLMVQSVLPENVQRESPAAGASSSVSSASTTSTTSTTSLQSNAPLPTHNLKTEIDPNAPAKYAERCDTCRATISTAFFELTTALTNLHYLDEELKEKKRKEAQKLLETIAETIKVWPPPKKPLKVMR
ncbi:DUF3102 domain-containing protein [Desulfitobacterium chlororespirans]|uniref:Protein export cytoplasm protein SecA ATPase RNA helicase n=1 Tax=Desulfitobacterium chlororespirans DSM 11544 TaxID=1121395 RepID=A0A1M7TWY2_9FIRM|nr:DUF3102 domain-containing protein [Desulfitobacterium chlororespirans]SHN75210.1 Protein of unknown function [Desulfitobacterium chlororespirans DSM 11544]